MKFGLSLDYRGGKANLFLEIDPESLSILVPVDRYLRERQIEAYLVGGFIRDTLLARSTGDIDIAVGGDVLQIAPAMAEALGGTFVLLDEANRIARVVFSPPAESPTKKQWSVDLTTLKGEILEDLEKSTGNEIDDSRAALNTLGLNHLTWHRGFKVDGEELWRSVFPAFIEKTKKAENPEWDIRTLEILGMIPNYYLQYFYYTDKKLEAQKKWPPSRAEEVVEIEKDLLRKYAAPALTEPPAALLKRGGAYYSTLATQLINSHYNDLGQIHVVNVRNNGAVKEWASDWVLEMPAQVDRRGIHPLPAAPLPPACFGLISQVKMYELLTVQAAVHGDKNALYQALLTHPLGPGADQAQAVMDDMLEANQPWLPQFFK